MGRLPYKRGNIVDWPRLHRETKQVFDKLGVEINPKVIVRSLGVAQRQFVEIAKALSQGANFVIMDEPTSSLSLRETENLFKVIRTLKASGITVMYVSHKLEELFQICDSVTVLRDGEFIATKSIDECTETGLVELMVGRKITTLFPKVQVPIGEPVLKVENLTRGNEFRNISFTLHKGEILGLAGLVGAGRIELARCLFGITRPDAGRVLVNGKALEIKNPLDAMGAEICLVPEDRKSQGLVLKMSVQHNASLATLTRFGRLLGFIDGKSEVDAVKQSVDSDVLVSAVEAAHAAGIPVITIDRTVNTDKVITHIGVDDVVGGRMAGEYVAERLGGKGNVIMLEGVMGSSAQRDRAQGFEEAISKYPEIKLLTKQTANFNRVEGMNVTENLLQAYPQVDAIFAQNDEMALGAFRAIEASGKKGQIILVGYDADPEAKDAVKAGEMDATIEGSPYKLGRLGIEAAVDHLNGVELPPQLLVDLDLVTQDKLQ